MDITIAMIVMKTTYVTVKSNILVIMGIKLMETNVNLVIQLSTL